jgi:peptidoglycan/xylan/chitin deacetylase (PgdA/CDA1 family)
VTLRRFRTRLWKRRGGTRQPVALLYHRVADLRADPHLLGISQKHFHDHLEVIRSDAKPRSLIEVVDALNRGCDVDPATVVLTFDDGYADNLYNAKAGLEQHAIPATFFVTTAYVGSGREFRW